MYRIRTARKGFTLIELLVVIAIIAILAAILFPIFLTAKQAAQRSACVDRHKQLATAWMSYHSDWNGYSVMAARASSPGMPAAWNYWPLYLKNYVGKSMSVSYARACL